MAKLQYVGQIPFHELHFEATRSRGPGGQNVNMRSTAIILRWSPLTTQAFTSEERVRLAQKLRRHLTAEAHEVHIRSERFRSHEQNRRDCLHKLDVLIEAALHIRKTRKKTKPTKAVREKRHFEKKHRAEVKKGRRSIDRE